MSRERDRRKRQAASAEKARNESKRARELHAELEARLRAALRGEAYTPPTAKPPRPSAHRAHRIVVVLSCRPLAGGMTVRFEHMAYTISRFEAELEARRAAQAAGLDLETAVLIDVYPD